jgi:hypothetical protein
MDIFARMLAGGPISKNDPELAAMWDVVARAIRLSPALNAATDTDQIRRLLGELIGQQIDASTTVFAPFHTNFGWHITLGKNVFINHACTMLDLGGRRPRYCPASRWVKTLWWRRAPWCTKTWRPILSWAASRPGCSR